MDAAEQQASWSISAFDLAGRLIYPVAALVALPCLLRLAGFAWHSEINSHILLVPLICAYLLRLRRPDLPAANGRSRSLAFFLLAGAALLWIAANRFDSWAGQWAREDQMTLFVLALVFSLWSAGFFFKGWRWMAAAAFPVSFLIFLVPLPVELVLYAENLFKNASSEVANVFFFLSGMPFIRKANVFELPGITIEVSAACSGIRSSYILILTALLAANLFLVQFWRRAALVAFVIPLGIIRNAFRVWVISMLCVHVNPDMIDSMIHRRGGPLFFVLSLVPFALLLWALRRLPAKARRHSMSRPAGSGQGSNSPIVSLAAKTTP